MEVKATQSERTHLATPSADDLVYCPIKATRVVCVHMHSETVVTQRPVNLD